MKLAYIATASGPRVCLAREGRWVDLHGSDPSLPTTMKALLTGGSELLRHAAQVAGSAKAAVLPPDTKLLPPVHDPQKIICLGLNYADHAQESGVPIPRDPVLFSKYATALIGHEDAIVLPSCSNEVDYEAELVFVVGKRGRHIAEADAMSYLAGYTIGHDVSARDWQLKKDGKQWMVGKTFDTFAPTGPWLITRDEIEDPHNLNIQLRLNGQVMQSSNTRQMIFRAPAILAYLSRVMTLEPGDLIFTGTPPGVGMARKPPVFLKPGDVAEVEVEKLGVLRNPVVAE